MLDDRERRLWQDIERRLVADDPGFRRRMRAAGRTRRTLAPVLWGVLCSLVAVLLWLLAGWPAGIAGAAAGLVLLPVVLRRVRRRREERRHGPGRR